MCSTPSHSRSPSLSSVSLYAHRSPSASNNPREGGEAHVRARDVGLLLVDRAVVADANEAVARGGEDDPLADPVLVEQVYDEELHQGHDYEGVLWGW